MNLRKYLAESERQRDFLSAGDTFTISVNEELAIEMPVVYHNGDSAMIEMDGTAFDILEACGCEFEEEEITETKAEYRGRKVKLNKPMRGDVKKYKVFVRHPKTGNVVKVNFGSKEMEIKRDDPKRRKSFRARHKCADKTAAKDRHTAGYWSCRMWTSKPVSDILKGK